MFARRHLIVQELNDVQVTRSRSRIVTVQRCGLQLFARQAGPQRWRVSDGPFHQLSLRPSKYWSGAARSSAVARSSSAATLIDT